MHRLKYFSPLAFIVVVGCATGQLSAERVTSVVATIRSADELGARAVPQAALHLTLAEEELAEAKKLAAEGDQQRGGTFLERATADAELAIALTRLKDAEAEALQARKAVAQLEGAQ